MTTIIMTVIMIGVILNTVMLSIITVLVFKIRRCLGKSDAEPQYTYDNRWNADDVLSGKMADDFFKTYYSSIGKIGEDDTAG